MNDDDDTAIENAEAALLMAQQSNVERSAEFATVGLLLRITRQLDVLIAQGLRPQASGGLASRILEQLPNCDVCDGPPGRHTIDCPNHLSNLAGVGQ